MIVVQTTTAPPAVPAENRPVERTAPRNGAFVVLLIVIIIAFQARRRRHRREAQAVRDEEAMRDAAPPEV